MHGLINRSIQCFLRDAYGQERWHSVVQAAQLDFDSFETMLHYDDAVTEALLDAAAAVLGRPRDTVLEDLGTYLVAHPNLEPLRRLLRFGGVRFLDFLHSLDDLPERGHLAVPDLDLPQLELIERGGGEFTLLCRGGPAGSVHVLVGVLRAMADDYGALVLLDHSGRDGGAETISIHLLDHCFTEGRRFALAAGG